jgi:hypothetical protein
MQLGNFSSNNLGKGFKVSLVEKFKWLPFNLHNGQTSLPVLALGLKRKE